MFFYLLGVIIMLYIGYEYSKKSPIKVHPLSIVLVSLLSWYFIIFSIIIFLIAKIFREYNRKDRFVQDRMGLHEGYHDDR